MPVIAIPYTQREQLKAAVKKAATAPEQQVGFVYLERLGKKKGKQQKLADKQLPGGVTLLPMPISAAGNSRKHQVTKQQVVDALEAVQAFATNDNCTLFVTTNPKTGAFLYPDSNQALRTQVLSTMQPIIQRSVAQAKPRRPKKAHRKQAQEPKNTPQKTDEEIVCEFEQRYQGGRHASWKLYVAASVLPKVAFDACAPDLVQSAAYRALANAQAKLDYLKRYAKDNPSSRTADVLSSMGILGGGGTAASVTAPATEAAAAAN
jgi:hypothetical protein